MCCLIMTIAFFGPRLGFLFYWLTSPERVSAAFNSLLWPVVGVIFVPWTTLVYTVVYRGGITGIDWVWIALALVVDLVTWGGSGSRRRQVPGYPGRAP